MANIINKNFSNSNIVLILIIFSSFFIDKIYISNTFYLAEWDQGYHLSNLFRTYNILEKINLFSFDWWNDFWSITNSYRGPLTYAISSFFLFIFGKTYNNSLLSNQIFSIITILSIYNISKELGDEKSGLWASFIFAFNPYIFEQRVDYLIDLSQLSFITLNCFNLFKLLNSRNNLLYCFSNGITLGFLFSVKPTGILYIALPYIYTFYIKFKKEKLNKRRIFFIPIFFSSFLIIIWPWLSLNWLTIFTSILNSWQWGINYQEGLEANTFEGILFYPTNIIKLLGPYILGSYFVVLIIEKYKSSKNINFKCFKFKKIFSENYFLFLITIINILMICTLMSTKVLRFILPIMPFLSIISGLYLSKLTRYKWIEYYKYLLIITILITMISIKIDFKNFRFLAHKDLNEKIPYNEIISEIDKFSPNLTSVIAVIPDTKELNTFNLDAEANLQNKNIYFRQIVSNDKSYKEDLNRFNWFLIKNGNQGVMTNQSKLKLSNLVEKSASFENFMSWQLPDGSTAKLLKRKLINEKLSLINESSIPNNLILNFQENGLIIKIESNSEILNDSNLLISAKNNTNNYEINISFPKIFNLNNKNIVFTKNLFNGFLLDDSLHFSALILPKDSKPLSIKINKITDNKNVYYGSKYDFEFNNIEEVDKMGRFLKEGEFDELFNLVGLVNQSDPEQEYLKDAEEIFKYRYQLDNTNIDYLYNIAISQILQRKSLQASKTLLEIRKIDSNNPHLYLAKSVVDIYNFKPRKAERNILIAKKLNKKESLRDTINTVNLISNIVNLRIRSLIDL